MKGKKDPPSPFDDDPDPEIREAWLQVQADRKAGRLKKPPRRAIDCHSLEDLCRYIFKLAYLDGSYQMFKTDAGIERWVWFGHEFGDRLVSVVEQIAPRIPNRHELIELRLAATRVSANGVQRLRRAFPTTMVTVYSDEAHDKNWELSQAAYTPG